MPPKKKGSSKKPPKARTPTLIDGLTKDEMSKEQLEEHIVRLREELDREREERNYFQLEKDKIHTFWEITERQLGELKDELKNFDKDVEDDERRHQVEIKVYKQKMKHLLCEHQNMISELNADALVSAEVVEKEQEQLEARLHREMKAIKVDMQELDNESLVKECQLKHDEEMIKTRNGWEEQLTEIKAKYERKMELLSQELDNMRKNEISERENHWNSHITSLIEDHNKALSDTKALAHHLHHDMEMTQSLQTQIDNHNVEQEEKEEEQVTVLDDNKDLAELLAKVEEKNAEIVKKMKNFSIRKDITEKVRKRERSNLQSPYAELKQRFSKLQLERDELYKTFSENVQRVQHKAGVKSVLLEQKLKAVTESLEKMQAQLSSMLSAPNMDHTALGGITSKMEENLNSSNDSIKNLQCRKALIAEARKDLLRTHEAKLRALRVPVLEQCVEPFESCLTGKTLGQDLDLGFVPKGDALNPMK